MTTADPGRRDLLKGALVGAAAVAGVAALSACDTASPQDSAQDTGEKDTETAFKALRTAVPYPASLLKDSVERRNLRERLLRYNVPSKISYLYLLTAYGQVVSYFPIKGKVSSTQSQMTTTNLIDRHNDSYGGNVVVMAPGDDGSYGDNEPGIFAFTTDDVMITWNGPYLLTDAPLKINQNQLVLEYREGSQPTSSSRK